MKLDFKIGDKVLVKDYGRKFSERLIVGETSRSWIVGISADSPWTHLKFPKKRDNYRLFYTQDEATEYLWREENRYRLSAFVQAIDDTALLKQIAALVGYKEPPQKP